MRNLRSRSFTSNEVAFRPSELPAHLAPVAYFAQGYLQAFRDFLWGKYKREIRLEITSGYRSPSRNAGTKGSAGNSYHTWSDLRPSPEGREYAAFAVDMKSPDLPLPQLYEDAAAFCRGEVYLNRAEGIVHIAPHGIDEKFVR